MSPELATACPPDAHVLVVGTYDPDSPDACFEVLHRQSCPAFGERVNGVWTVTGFNCGVGFHVAAAGIDSWFRHEQHQPGRYDASEPLATGRHVIAPWSRQVRTFDFVEWDGGLEVIGADEHEVPT